MLDPFDPNEFLTKHWTQKFLIVRGHDKKFEDFFSWEDFNRVLGSHISAMTGNYIGLSKDGKGIPRNRYTHRKSGKYSSEKINALCREGATLILNTVNLLDNKLKHLISRLSAEFGERAQVNVYASWKNTQGFNAHFDTHEVIILQIEGSKEWDLYEDHPTQYPKLEHHDSFDPQQMTPTKFTLNKGDLLYIPRGIWHSAITVDEPSLHLTIGLPCRTRTHFLRWAIEEMYDLKSFRENLPVSYGADQSPGYVDEDMNDVLEVLKKDISSFLSDKSLIKKV